MKLKKRGFTLLEVLLAALLLVIGVIALSWAFSLGIFASSGRENVELALGIAQAKLETIYGTKGGVANETIHNVSDEGFIGDIYQNQNFQIGVETDDNDPEKVDVTVYWDTKGGQTNITLTTLVTDW